MAFGCWQAHPDGLCIDGSGAGHLDGTNANEAQIEVDLAYLRQAITSVAANTYDYIPKIDSRRIYFGGHSNGCFETSRFLSTNSDLVAAVSGCMAGGGVENIQTPLPSDYIPTPVYLVHGDNDVVNPFQGAVETAAFWAEASGGDVRGFVKGAFARPINGFGRVSHPSDNGRGCGSAAAFAMTQRGPLRLSLCYVAYGAAQAASLNLTQGSQLFIELFGLNLTHTCIQTSYHGKQTGLSGQVRFAESLQTAIKEME